MPKATQFTPITPEFTGKVSVLSPKLATLKKTKYYVVDLDKGTCECTHGKPLVEITDMRTRERKIVTNGYCVHKIKAIADICKNSKKDLTWPYIKAVATRYNMYEVVSAFHKELRRGDSEKAYYWAMMLTPHRGLKGVIRYMINILYEETRDHKLLDYLLTLYEEANTASHPMSDIALGVSKAILWFCATPKKWELDHRYDIFNAEMQGYKLLMDDYGNDVAKPKEIIHYSQTALLKAHLKSGYKHSDLEAFQQGLKGLFKSKSDMSHDAHKQWLFDTVADLAKKYMTEEISEFIARIRRKQKIVKDTGYHDINALADLITGEPYTAGFISRDSAKKIRALKAPLKLSYGFLHKMPLYAHDNHTWYGKSLMKKFPNELKPEADQRYIDFRFCGAYFGVAWRTLAYRQHGTVNVKWSDVVWPPRLYSIVNRMWY